MFDVVFPEGNENEFIRIAQVLGLEGLVFVYSSKADFFSESAPIAIKNALYIKPEQIHRARSLGALAVCPASREAIERGADVVFGFELSSRDDKTHYRKSGLNQVLCRLASRKGVKIGFSFRSILDSPNQRRAVVLGRMAQNALLCEKFEAPIAFASFAKRPSGMRSSSDMASVMRLLGFSEKSIRQGLGF